MNIIKIENLSKKYIIGHDKAATGMYRYRSLRDSIAHTCRGIVQRIRHPLSPNIETTALEEFWALRDINLEIKQGDKVGIIGRNGAGKSTLLKILSRITEPTTGKVTIKGRIASLLEVGTGFHPELSGRENIYLNGAVLGMARKEIKKKFDEIVDFAGVEKFLDTPVKRYSSGMYVRLAFAVAAHLDPEILLIDEVLAVGDAEFQKKCLGKMDDVSKQGRTILFVSHNMAAIRQLCNKSILLEKGLLKIEGNTEGIIDTYTNVPLRQDLREFIPKYNNFAYIKNVEVASKGGKKNNYTTDDEIEINIDLVINEFLPGTDLLLFIHSDKLARRLFLIEESLKSIKNKASSQTAKIKITLSSNFLMKGSYNCEIGILNNVSNYIDHHSEVCPFDIEQGTNSFLKYQDRDLGVVFAINARMEIY